MRSRFERLLFILSISILTGSNLANAQAMQKLSPDKLALGLDKLRWGMSPKEAGKLFPATGSAPGFSDWRAYSHGGCTYSLSFVFYPDDKLHQAGLDWEGPDYSECLNQVSTELAARYDNEGSDAAPAWLFGQNASKVWGGKVTSVALWGTLPPTPQSPPRPPHFNVTFFDSKQALPGGF